MAKLICYLMKANEDLQTIKSIVTGIIERPDWTLENG